MSVASAEFLSPNRRAEALPRLLGTSVRLHRDKSGATAVEFAIVAPFFFFLMFVIAETALIFIAEQVMDNAVFESARLVRTGQAPKANMSQADYKADLCGRMRVFINCNSPNFFLEVKKFNDFAALTTYTNADPVNEDKTFKPGSYCNSAQSDIMLVRAYYQWPTNKIFWGLSLASPSLGNGKRLIGSFAAFRNEPFGKTATANC